MRANAPSKPSATPMTSRSSSASVDSSMSRAEAALGRFVLDEEVEHERQHLLQPVAARRPPDRASSSRLVRTSPDQRRRVEELQQLYAQRGAELALAARAAAAKQGQGGTAYYYAGRPVPMTGPAVARKLDEIADSERQSLRQRIEQSQIFSARRRPPDRLSSAGSASSSVSAPSSSGWSRSRRCARMSLARRLAESEAERAEVLEQAVAERTRELTEANEALQRRSGRARKLPRRSCARSRRWRRWAS